MCSIIYTFVSHSIVPDVGIVTERDKTSGVISEMIGTVSA